MRSGDPMTLTRRRWLGALAALPTACIPPALRPARCYAVAGGGDPSCREVLWSYNSIQFSRSTVVRPSSVRELAQTLRETPRRGRRVTFRGGGAALDGQSLNGDTVIALDSPEFAQVSVDLSDHDAPVLVVGAGATWQKVLDHTLPLGLVPYCMPSASFIRVGGGLAANSFSRMAARWGREERYVRGFTLVTAGGDVVACAPDLPEGSLGRELFFAVPGSQGYLGVVTEARYALRRIGPPGASMCVHTRQEVFTIASNNHGYDGDINLSGFLRRLELLSGDADHARADDTALPTAMTSDGVFGTIWWARDRRRTLRGLLGTTTYEPTPPGSPSRGLLNRRNCSVRIYGEYGFAEPGGEASLQDINFHLARCAPDSFDPIDDFAFFQDADARAKHFAEPRWRMTAAEEAYCVPLRYAVHFLERLDEIVMTSGHTPALVDLLYAPRDRWRHPLSATSESNTMVFTVAYLDRNGERWDCTRDVYRRLARECARLEGKVYLAKTVEVDADDLERMWGEGARALRAIKRRVDPDELLANEFWDRNLGCLTG